MNKSDKNKTGVSANPVMAKQMLAVVDNVPVMATGSAFGDDGVRVDYAKAVPAHERSYGSVPPPEPKLLTNKLGERLAFERTGVRLYEILISKLDALGSFKGGPKREDLQALLNDEHCHFSLVHAAILELGGDPTMVTPAADLVGILASGVLKVMADPRTTLLESLEAVLVAELADTAGWNMLVAIARAAGKKKLAKAFEVAEQTEELHREKVQSWIAAGFKLKL